MNSKFKKQGYWTPDVTNSWIGRNWMELLSPPPPAVDLIEMNEYYLVVIEAPEVEDEDFHLELDEDQNLIVTIEKKPLDREEKKEKEPFNPHRWKYGNRKFQQKVNLTDEVERDKITAVLEDEELRVVIPKVKPAIR